MSGRHHRARKKKKSYEMKNRRTSSTNSISWFYLFIKLLQKAKKKDVKEAFVRLCRASVYTKNFIMMI